jgi:hypothetical protein
VGNENITTAYTKTAILGKKCIASFGLSRGVYLMLLLFHPLHGPVFRSHEK